LSQVEERATNPNYGKQNGDLLNSISPEVGDDDNGPAHDDSMLENEYWQQQLTHFLSRSGGNELVRWVDVSEDHSEERRIWDLVNGTNFGLGRGSTTEEAKEHAARRGLESLRSFYGVKDGILMEEIERNPNLDRESPPIPTGLCFELVRAPERDKKGCKSYKLGPVVGKEGERGEEGKRGKLSTRRWWKHMGF